MWKIINWRKSTREYEEARREADVRYPGIPEKTFQMEQRRKRKRNEEHVSNFISNSTLHGLHFCFDKKHLIRRIVWTMILIAAFGYVGEKIYASLVQFFQYPMSTTTTLVYDKQSINFPAFSICNLNDFRKSKFKGTKVEKYFRAFGQGRKIPEQDVPNGTVYRTTVREANHKLSSMLTSITAPGKYYNLSHISSYFEEYWDSSGTTRCYTFNSRKSGKILSVSVPGVKHAVEMEFDVQQYDYYDTKQAGLKLILHGQDETPVKTAGMLLSPGTSTYIEISKRKRINLRKPYRTNCGSLKLRHFKSYSQHLCWLDKLTSYLAEKCGCVDAFMPEGYEICNITMLIKCAWPEWVYFDKVQDYHCPIPCEIEEFITKTSTALYPSNRHADSIAKKKGLKGFPMENRMLIRENYLKFTVFFGDLSYELVEQIPSYDLKVLLGDIGGQLGLFLGSSLLTYVEFFDCMLMVIYTKYFEVLLPK